MKAKINPNNLTEVWFTIDDRDPTLDDNDFVAGFYWKQNGEKVEKAVAEIVLMINSK